jgi:hypothetical protein
MKKPSMAEILASDVFPLPEWDDEWDGSCPCSDVTGRGFKIWLHCWRSACTSCRFAGVHVSGTIPKKDLRRIGRHIAKLNAARWSAEFSVVVEPKK